MTRKRLAVLAGLLLGASLVFLQARWYVLEIRIHNVLLALPKEPTPSDLLALRGRIEKEERSLFMSPSAVALEIWLEQHDSNGRAFREDSAQLYWFVVVDARSGSRAARWEQRIDNRIAETDSEALERGRVRVVRRGERS